MSVEVSALLALGIDRLSDAVRAGALDPAQVAAAFCDHLESVNPSLNAVVDYDRACVLGEAAVVSSRLRAGEALPLAGVPITIKDNLWVEGRRIAQGSRLYAEFIAPRDAWAVARLREAGAIFLGITHTPEFACRGVAESPLHGVARHPLDPSLTPGGSSGGAAAALAAGIGLAALGTDAGGSIRRPAAHCGLVGLKPSAGLVPHPWGFGEPNYGFSVVGVLARSVADCEAVYRELMAYDAGDASAPPIRMNLASGRPADARMLRVAWSPSLGCGFPVDHDVLAQFERGIGHLREAGFPINRADPVWPEGTGAYPLIALQQRGLHLLYGSASSDQLSQLDPDIRGAMDQGEACPPDEWLMRLRQLEAIRSALARFFNEYDLLLCPSAPVTAWPIGDWPMMIGGQEAGPRGHAAFTPLFNYCGVPALSLPCGRVRGLPVGLQAVAPRFEDARLLTWAAHAESLLQRQRPD